jgi:putative DNA methylase
MSDHPRLIEDYLPIEAISAEASREKFVRKGHISTLHIWLARRPLVACRAAVYGALVPANRWVKEVELKNPTADHAKAEGFRNGDKRGLNRQAATEFLTKLCKYPGDPKVIAQAQRHILEAHAERLTREIGKPVTIEDIESGRAPRPKVLDMFAGGGAIPLEALRLGCEAYALDLNPVAHIIELCTLVYPQKYGQPDRNVPGMTGQKHTWGGLAEEVRYWGRLMLDRVRKEIGDLYPPIPDPEVWAESPEIEFDRQTGGWKVIQEGKLKRGVRLVDRNPERQQGALVTSADEDDEADDDESDGHEAAGDVSLPPGFLQPVAYLWTRTVRCKNPACGATVPLVRQTWLCKKKNRYVALKMIADKPSQGRKPTESPRVRFEVVESDTKQGLGFDPAMFSKAGNATCPFCGTVADNGYVKAEGRAGLMGTQPMSVVCTRPGRKGKVYLAADNLPAHLLPDDADIEKRIAELCQRTSLTVPDEPIANLPADCYDNTLGITIRPYGLTRFCHLFTPRQMLCLLTFTATVRESHQALLAAGHDADRCKAVAAYLGIVVDRLADYCCVGATWRCNGGTIRHYISLQALTMVWDFAELAPFGGESGSPEGAIEWVANVIASCAQVTITATILRGSATALPWGVEGGTGFQPLLFDAVITDPPLLRQRPLRRHLGLLLRLAEALDWPSLPGAFRHDIDAQETGGGGGLQPARQGQRQGQGGLRRDDGPVAG